MILNRTGRAAAANPNASPGWASICWRVFASISKHRLLTTSGGVAFFALLAIFPALATIVSLYSLFADPYAIPERVALLAGVVPTSIIDLIKQEIQSLAEKNINTLSTAFFIGLLVSMWSANAGVSALFDALNVVRGETESRSLLQFFATTFAVTLGAIVCGLVAIIGVLPISLRALGLGENAENLSAIFRWPATLLVVMIWLSIVYRIGPSRRNGKWRWVTWGSGLAGILLVVASMIFNWYLVEIQQLRSAVRLIGRRRRLHDLAVDFCGRHAARRGTGCRDRGKSAGMTVSERPEAPPFFRGPRAPRKDSDRARPRRCRS